MKRAIEMYEPAVTAAIVDDEFHFIEEMKKLLAHEPGIEVIATEHDPGHAVEQLVKAKPDLVFLDIQMPEVNGFDVIRGLREASFEPSVIFVTAYDNYAIQAIKTAAFDYLLKPIEKRELQKSIQRFFDYHAREERMAKYLNLLESVDYQRKIKLANAGGFLLVNLSDIIYIQADWNYSKVFTGPDTFETVTMNLGSLDTLLPDKGFMRINRSTIINLSYLTRVRRLARKCFLMKDGHEYEFCIPITRIRELEKKIIKKKARSLAPFSCFQTCSQNTSNIFRLLTFFFLLLTSSLPHIPEGKTEMPGLFFGEGFQQGCFDL